MGGWGRHSCETTIKRGRLETTKVKLCFHSHSQPAFAQKHGRVCPSAPRAVDRAAPSAHTQHLPAVQKQAWEPGQSKQPRAAGRHSVGQGQQLVTGPPSSPSRQHWAAQEDLPCAASFDLHIKTFGKLSQHKRFFSAETVFSWIKI